MNVLDENITRDQVELLVRWRIPHRLLAIDFAAQGTSDEDIFPLLLRLKRPTFFTRDADFFEHHRRHGEFALVFLNVHAIETAFYIKKFLRDNRFHTTSLRLGKVFRVQQQVVEYWSKGPELTQLGW